MGGPFGAVVGAALGHAADQGDLSLGKLSLGPRPGGGLGSARLASSLAAMLGQREQSFSMASIVLSAKLAKCDGPVTREEIDAFKRAFRIPPEAMGQVGQLFDASRQSAEGYEPVARQLGKQFRDRPERLEGMLAALFTIARADKPLTVAEDGFLHEIHAAFGLDEASWERASGTRATPRPPKGSAEEDPYLELGLTAHATDEQVRAAWKRLVREYHPDTQASRGASPSQMRHASDRVARINAAWDAIKRLRGL